MSIRIDAERGLVHAALAHLERPGERIGFFLADVTATGTFVLRQWRPVADDEIVPSLHAILADGAAADIVRWAFDAGKSLVEVHTHGRLVPAAFSPIDVDGFDDWVHGVRWRLRGAPYAAVVVAEDTIDAWAWTGTSKRPEQVDAIVIDGTDIIRTTRATMERLHD